MLTSIATDGRPVSTTKRALSRYKGSRSAYSSRKRTRVWHLQQGTTLVMAQTAKDFFGRRMQIHRIGALLQVLAIDRPQHRTAARRQNAGLAQRQLINDRLLEVTKWLLAFPFKERADGQADALLDDVIGVQEGPSQPSGQMAPDRGFSGAGKTDQSDVVKGSQWAPMTELAVSGGKRSSASA